MESRKTWSLSKKQKHNPVFSFLSKGNTIPLVRIQRPGKHNWGVRKTSRHISGWKAGNMEPKHWLLTRLNFFKRPSTHKLWSNAHCMIEDVKRCLKSGPQYAIMNLFGWMLVKENAEDSTAEWNDWFSETGHLTDYLFQGCGFGIQGFKTLSPSQLFCDRKLGCFWLLIRWFQIQLL